MHTTRHPAPIAPRCIPPLLLLSSIAAVSLLCGCKGGGGTVPVTGDSWTGPPMNLVYRQPSLMVVMTAPTAGWSLSLDRTRRAYGHTDVFLTATAPDPTAMQTQAQINHEVGLGSIAEAVDVYARTLEHAENPGRQPYQLVVTSPGIKPPTSGRR